MLTYVFVPSLHQGDLFDELRRRKELMAEGEVVELVALPVINALAYIHSMVIREDMTLSPHPLCVFSV